MTNRIIPTLYIQKGLIFESEKGEYSRNMRNYSNQDGTSHTVVLKSESHSENEQVNIEIHKLKGAISEKQLKDIECIYNRSLSAFLKVREEVSKYSDSGELTLALE